MGDDGASTLEGTLQDVVSRYSFMDLWPCSSSDLDNLSRQEVILILIFGVCTRFVIDAFGHFCSIFCCVFCKYIFI